MHRRREKSKIFKPSTLVAVLIVLIMVSGGMGYFFGDDQTLRYNDHKFKRTDQGYATEINDNLIHLSFLPADVEDIGFSSTAKSLLLNPKAVYVTYDPNNKLNSTMAQIQYDMERIFYPVTGIYLQRALVDSAGYDIMEITCENATDYMPVIELKFGNETSIIAEGSCLFVQAQSQSELVRAYNRVLYSAFDIMK